ncbi:MAG: helix-turn-helix domain-containing protein [Bdellovibrionales bacterium]|nr:helix-turn-helix domain-containing protein [Bdellovibrionales bacterium]
MSQANHPINKNLHGKNKIDIGVNNYLSRKGFDKSGTLDVTLFDNRIWMDTREAAEYLRISVNGLRLKVWKRQIPAYKFNRHLRFKKSDLDQYMRPLR